MSRVVRAYVAIGSNIERERHIASGVAALRDRFGAIRVSPVYASAPVGMAGGEFYNLVAAVDTDLPVDAVAAILREIESAHGRRRGEDRNAPRTLDLDLLTYGDAVLEVDGLRLPRSDIVDYGFVLGPLAALAPDDRHPRLGSTYAALWAGRPAGDRAALRRVPDFLRPSTHPTEITRQP